MESNSVKVVAVTRGVGEHDGLTGEQIIGYVARVSNPQNQPNLDTVPKLLKYCIKNGHWSVFETSYMTMEIETSLSIAMQILRHRSFTFQQFSARYAEMSDVILYPARRQDTKNRQNSVDDMTYEDKVWFETQQQQVWDTAKLAYEDALKRGIAKEQARFLLPNNTKTRLYMTGNVRSWITYIQARDKKAGAQKEHADIAEKCKEHFKEYFPSISKALEW